MKLRCLALLALSIPLAACGGEDENFPIDAAAVDGAVADAPTDAQVIDALVVDAPVDAPSSVQLIANCTGVPSGQEDLVVSAASGAYMPQNPTIQVDDVVRFEPGSPAHDMAADNGEFQTPLGQLTCLRFTAAGTFPFHCSVHLFAGTITVQ